MADPPLVNPYEVTPNTHWNSYVRDLMLLLKQHAHGGTDYDGDDILLATRHGFAGDTDTYMGTPGANQIDFYVGGSQRLVLGGALDYQPSSGGKVSLSAPGGKPGETLLTNDGNSYRADITRMDDGLAFGTHSGTGEPADALKLVDGAAASIANLQILGKVTNYNSVATEGYGVPAIIDYDARTGQSANIAAVTPSNGGPAGVYRVTFYMSTTTAGNAVTVTPQINYTDEGGARVQNAGAGFFNLAINAVAGNFNSCTFTFKQTSGTWTWQTNQSGALGAGRYAIVVISERLN